MDSVFTAIEHWPLSIWMREGAFAYFIALIFHAFGMAVLVGGIAIHGGQGRIYDAACGALFLAIVGNVLLLEGFSLDVQLMVKGAVVLLSVLAGALLTFGRRS